MKRKETGHMNNRNKGFSLIEVLLAIVILGLVAGVQLLAATDVATMTMEYLSGQKMDVDDGIRETFQDTNNVQRIPGVSYASEASKYSSYADLEDFTDEVVANLTDIQTKHVYYNAADADSGALAVAMNAVEYNSFVFDMIILFEPSGSSDDYFTYNVTIDVYRTEEGMKEDPSDADKMIPTVIHYAEKIATINGVVVNQ